MADDYSESAEKQRLKVFYYDDDGIKKFLSCDDIFIKLSSGRTLTVDVSGLQDGIGIYNESAPVKGQCTSISEFPTLIITPGASNIITVNSVVKTAE